MTRIDLHNYEAFLLDHSEGRLTAQVTSELRAFLLAHPELEIDLEEGELPYLSQPDQETADFKNSLRKHEEPLQDEALLNYLEGTLGQKDRAAFERQLALDPSLVAALEAYRNTILGAEKQVVAEFKAGLRKTEDDLVLNNRLIAYVEKQLAPAELASLEKELRHSAALRNELALLSQTVLAADASIVYPDKEALKKENKVIALFSLRTLGAIAAALLLVLGLSVVYRYTTSREPVSGGLAVLPAKKAPDTDKKHAGIDSKSIQPATPETTNTQLTPSGTTAASQPAHPGANEVATQPAATGTAATNSPPVIPEAAIGPLANHPQEKQLANALEARSPEIPAHTSEKTINDSSITSQNYLALAEELPEETDFDQVKNASKPGFWKRAVRIAQQANKLGVKSIDGQENTESKYRLSFNSFSVGKK